jgi:hypothetical protein
LTVLFKEYLPDFEAILAQAQSIEPVLDEEDVLMEQDFTYSIGDAPILSQ